MTATPFEDGPNPCSCPREVAELLNLGVRYAEASLGSSRPDTVLGAQYLRDFMQQPSEVWCRYIEGCVDDRGGAS